MPLKYEDDDDDDDDDDVGSPPTMRTTTTSKEEEEEEDDLEAEKTATTGFVDVVVDEKKKKKKLLLREKRDRLRSDRDDLRRELNASTLADLAGYDDERLIRYRAVCDELAIAELELKELEAISEPGVGHRLREKRDPRRHVVDHRNDNNNNNDDNNDAVSAATEADPRNRIERHTAENRERREVSDATGGRRRHSIEIRQPKDEIETLRATEAELQNRNDRLAVVPKKIALTQGCARSAAEEALSIEVRQLKEEIETLRATEADLRNRNERLEAENRKSKEAVDLSDRRHSIEIRKLEEKAAALSATELDLRCLNERLAADNADRTAEAIRLRAAARAEDERVTVRIRELEDQTAALSSTEADLRNRNERLAAENEDRTAEAEALRAKATELAVEVGTLAAAVAASTESNSSGVPNTTTNTTTNDDGTETVSRRMPDDVETTPEISIGGNRAHLVSLFKEVFDETKDLKRTVADLQGEAEAALREKADLAARNRALEAKVVDLEEYRILGIGEEDRLEALNLELTETVEALERKVADLEDEIATTTFRFDDNDGGNGSGSGLLSESLATKVADLQREKGILRRRIAVLEEERRHQQRETTVGERKEEKDESHPRLVVGAETHQRETENDLLRRRIEDLEETNRTLKEVNRNLTGAVVTVAETLERKVADLDKEKDRFRNRIAELEKEFRSDRENGRIVRERNRELEEKVARLERQRKGNEEGKEDDDDGDDDEKRRRFQLRLPSLPSRKKKPP